MIRRHYNRARVAFIDGTGIARRAKLKWGLLLSLLGAGVAAAVTCVLVWCSYYSSTPPVGQYQCGSLCAANNKRFHRVQTASTAAHRMWITELYPSGGGVVPGTQVSSTGSSAQVSHGTVYTNQYCWLSSGSVRITCQWND